MDILFCSHNPIVKNLGAPKVLVELSEELDKLGWNCRFIDSIELLGESGKRLKGNSFKLRYADALRDYLRQHAAEYDVIDYDHGSLPYPRKEFSSQTLFVARSVLLHHHFQNITIPLNKRGFSFKKRWKSKIRSLVLGKFYESQVQQRTQRVTVTTSEADLINVPNRDDKAELVRRSIPKEKIVVIPFGISHSRRHLFDAVSSNLLLEYKVAFVGTFDNRKGATDFPKIVKEVCQKVPGVSFLLLGTAGLYRSKKEVLLHFPKELRDRIEIIERYEPDELPRLLSVCSVGIFPSYIEGFPFGVLEMLAASIPVVAYNSPGPPMMLSPEYLVPRGDTVGMATKVAELLGNETKLAAARAWARKRSQQFCWQDIAKQTSEIYLKNWQKRQQYH